MPVLDFHLINPLTSDRPRAGRLSRPVGRDPDWQAQGCARRQGCRSGARDRPGDGKFLGQVGGRASSRSGAEGRRETAACPSYPQANLARAELKND